MTTSMRRPSHPRDPNTMACGPEDLPDPTGSASQSETGVEIGSTWMSSPIFIRTVGGVGISRVMVDLDSGESDLEGSSTQIQYGPGLLIALPTDCGTFAGLEIRWLKVTELESSPTICATIGWRGF